MSFSRKSLARIFFAGVALAGGTVSGATSATVNLFATVIEALSITATPTAAASNLQFTQGVATQYKVADIVVTDQAGTGVFNESVAPTSLHHGGLEADLALGVALVSDGATPTSFANAGSDIFFFNGPAGQSSYETDLWINGAPSVAQPAGTGYTGQLTIIVSR